MITGETKSGFSFEIEKAKFDDYELLEMIYDSMENPVLTIRLVRHLLGKEQTERLKAHVKQKDAYVSTSKLNDEIVEIFGAVETLKK